MNFTIYSIGDSAFLEQVLIALAIIVGTGDWLQACSIGLLLGFVIVSAQSIMNGGKSIEYHQLLLGFVFFSFMFASSTTVTVEDAYTGEIRVISGVPIGAAATGSFFSNIGYGMTKLFEQGFGVISEGVTSNEFGSAMAALTKVRRNATTENTFSTFNKIAGVDADVKSTLYNYIKECTLIKIDNGDIALDDLIELPILEALEYDNDMFMTLQKLGTNYTTVTCAVGFDNLSAVFNAAENHAETELLLKRMLALPSTSLTTGADKVSNAMTAIGGSTTTSGHQWLIASIIEPVYFAAAAGKLEDFHDVNAALAINQSIRQRNTEWAAEQTFFMSTLRPMLAFFEAILFALTPIVGFIVLIGSHGVKLAVKYMLLPIWIQLWYPLLAIINLYIHMGATGQMEDYQNVHDSIYAINSADVMMETWIATGGKLAASIPVLALFLISGSLYSMNSLAGSLKGNDYHNEKMSTPDAVKPSAVMGAMASYKTSAGGGTRGEDTGQASVNLGQGYQNAVQSASTKLDQGSDAFQNSLTKGTQSGSSHNLTKDATQRIGQDIMADQTKSTAAIRNSVERATQSYGLGEEQQQQLAGSLAASASAGIDTNNAWWDKALSAVGVSAKAQVSGKTESSDSATTSTSAQLQDAYEKSNGNSETTQQEIRESTAASIAKSTSENEGINWSETNGTNLGQTATRLTSAAETYSDLSAKQDMVGLNSSLDMGAVGNRLDRAGQSGDMNDLWNTYGSSLDQEQYNDLRATNGASVDQQGFGMDSRAAQTAAQFQMLLAGGGAGANAALDMLGGVQGQKQPDIGDSAANAGVATGTEGSGAPTKGDVPGAGTGIKPEDKTEFFRGHNNLNGETITGGDQVRGQADTNAAKVANEAAAQKGSRAEEATEQYMNASRKETSSGYVNGLVENYFNTPTHDSPSGEARDEVRNGIDNQLNDRQMEYYDAISSGDSKRIQAAADDIDRAYAERNNNDQPMVNDNDGSYMMSADNRAIADQIKEDIATAHERGSTGGTFLAQTGIGNFNQQAAPTDPSGSDTTDVDCPKPEFQPPPLNVNR